MQRHIKNFIDKLYSRTKHCPQIDKERKKKPWYYAHSGHYSNIICIARDFDKLPDRNKAGILLHEYGHIYLMNSNMKRHSEREADKVIDKLFGIKIKYDKNGIEYI